MLWRAAGEPEINDVLGPAKGLVGRRNPQGRRLAGGQQLGQAEPQQAEPAHAQQLPAIDPVTKSARAIVDG